MLKYTLLSSGVSDVKSEMFSSSTNSIEQLLPEYIKAEHLNVTIGLFIKQILHSYNSNFIQNLDIQIRSTN
jgi:hypothetical protein